MGRRSRKMLKALGCFTTTMVDVRRSKLIQTLQLIQTDSPIQTDSLIQTSG